MRRYRRRNTELRGKSADEFASSIRDRMGNPPDLAFRYLTLGQSPGVLVYIRGLADTTLLSETVLETLARDPVWTNENRITGVPVSSIRLRTRMDEAVDDLLGGRSILFRDGDGGCLALDTFKPKTRDVQEPNVETVVRGPRESFVENIGDNVALVRLGLKSPALRVRELSIGEFAGTTVNVLYVDGLAMPSIIQEVLAKLDAEGIKRLAGHGTIARRLQASPYTLFPTTMVTERPDRVVAGLLEGRVAVFTDRTPFCVMVPSVFVEHLQSPEDYYENPVLQSILRTVRYLMLHLSVLGPALYVALSTFHQEMIPTPLLVSLINQREVVPFPAVLEALIMGFVFEGLREAGGRLPRPMGQAVSIVGGIVLGQAAITAGIVSAAMIIVVGLTAIASFTVPSLSLNAPQLILRLVFLLGAGVFGLYGAIIIYLFVLGHLLSVRSFGIPYLFPLAPTFRAGIADTFVVTLPEAQAPDHRLTRGEPR
ncbi:MAG: spore germination protein [Clostridia bacterium]|nr:spore germination protein [Clostridia bacterium]MDQ7791301.1 spore germination protein [Clostridia bacterium]